MISHGPVWSPACPCLRRRSFPPARWPGPRGQKDVTLERGRFFPWEDYWRHAGSLVADEAKAHKFYDEHEALRLSYQGQAYYVGASHFQFVARRQLLHEVLPIPSQRPMGQVRLLDVAINEHGYLRLCTPQWYVQHMGNTVPGEGFFAGESTGCDQQAPEGRAQRAVAGGAAAPATAKAERMEL